MIRPQRPRRPDPVAMSQPVPPQKPLDQQKISRILGSTMEPVKGDVVQQALQHKAKSAPKPRPVIPRDPDGTEYHSVKYGSDGPCPLDGCREVGPHHHTTLRVSQDKDYATVGPSLFRNFRLLKRLLEEGKPAKEPT